MGPDRVNNDPTYTLEEMYLICQTSLREAEDRYYRNPTEENRAAWYRPGIRRCCMIFSWLRGADALGGVAGVRGGSPGAVEARRLAILVRREVVRKLARD